MTTTVIRTLTAAILLAVIPVSSANACTIIWNERDAKRRSDAVVWGTYEAGDKPGHGFIGVSRREKGPKDARLPIVWDTSWVDDGASCPIWQPNLSTPAGRFFLRMTADGRFVVDTQTPAKKAKK